VRFRSARDELSAMITDKNTADVLVELRSLVRSRELLIGLVEKEPRPESEKAAAVVNYGREIAALNAAIEALAGRPIVERMERKAEFDREGTPRPSRA
jgi:hypothetical protein